MAVQTLIKIISSRWLRMCLTLFNNFLSLLKNGYWAKIMIWNCFFFLSIFLQLVDVSHSFFLSTKFQLERTHRVRITLRNDTKMHTVHIHDMRKMTNWIRIIFDSQRPFSYKSFFSNCFSVWIYDGLYPTTFCATQWHNAEPRLQYRISSYKSPLLYILLKMLYIDFFVNRGVDCEMCWWA